MTPELMDLARPLQSDCYQHKGHGAKVLEINFNLQMMLLVYRTLLFKDKVFITLIKIQKEIFDPQLLLLFSCLFCFVLCKKDLIHPCFDLRLT